MGNVGTKTRMQTGAYKAKRGSERRESRPAPLRDREGVKERDPGGLLRIK